MIGDILSFIISIFIHIYVLNSKILTFIFRNIYRHIVKPKFKVGDIVNFSHASVIDIDNHRVGEIVSKKFYFTEIQNGKESVSKSWRYNIKESGNDKLNLQVPEKNIELNEDYIKMTNRDKSIDQLLGS